MNRLLVAVSCAAVAGAAATGAYIGVVTGRLTFDLGLGRRTRPLGPLHIDIAAPREIVFAAAAALSATAPRDLAVRLAAIPTKSLPERRQEPSGPRTRPPSRPDQGLGCVQQTCGI
jgi:hypothetical protein